MRSGKFCLCCYGLLECRYFVGLTAENPEFFKLVQGYTQSNFHKTVATWKDVDNFACCFLWITAHYVDSVRLFLCRANLHDAIMLYANAMRGLEGDEIDTAAVVKKLMKTSFDGKSQKQKCGRI